MDEIYLPVAVLEEIRANKELYALVSEFLDRVVKVKEVEIGIGFPGLHEGEQEAIILAKKLACWVVLDDLKARKVAEREGLKVIGTAGLLRVMKELGLIKEDPESLFRKLKRYGFRMKKEDFLRIMGRHGSEFLQCL